MDGIGAEGAVDKPPGVQVSQGIGDLEQQVHNHLHMQQGELGPLKQEINIPGIQGLGPDTVECFVTSKIFSIELHRYTVSQFYR